MTGTKPASRKRRRTPRSDWQLPLLSELGLTPQQQKLFVIIASVLGVIAGAFGLVAVVTTIGGDYVPERRASAATVGEAGVPSIYHGWASPKLFEPVADRTRDTQPLSEKEVFAQRTLSGEKKLTLKLVAKQLDADCSAALWGQDLLALLTDAGCSQAARGVYASSDGRYTGQYTLLNLRDGQAAGQLVEALKSNYRGGWTNPLPTGKAAFPPGGHTEAAGYALGHYVGLVWIGKSDGTEPTPRDDFVSLALTLRGAEKAIYRRVVAITGPAP